MNEHRATFDEYYRGTDDPWGFRTRWYEKRKRAILSAVLPNEAYETAWEIGCSNGELAATLAPRCSSLLATDGHEVAVRSAVKRLFEFSHATVQRLWVPEEWPAPTFDLIVLSELAYYLSRRDLQEFCRKLVPSLSDRGHFVACHWRPKIDGCAMVGDEVHELLTDELPWSKVVRHFENDFVLEIWSADRRSVAELEGLR